MTRESLLVFLASFLAFSLELAAAKSVLPRHGGGALVWAASLAVFQGLLVAAYLWARAAALRPRLHLAALALPLLVLPPRLAAEAPPPGPLGAASDLLLAFGLPFLALSTTTVVVQGALQRRRPGEARSAYSLFAWSNAGAFAALAGYPLVIEPFLGLDAQFRLLTAAYAFFLVLHAPLLAAAAPAAPEESAAPVPARAFARRLLLAAAPCAASLAAANTLSLDFAAMPLLWAAPTAVYLLTFVLSFRRAALDADAGARLLPPLAAWTGLCLLGAVLTLTRAGEAPALLTLRRLLDLGKFGYLLAALFVVGAVCHRALAAERPAGAADAARYYLHIALGGWAGTLAAFLLPPLLLPRGASPALEWLLAAALAMAALVLRDLEAWTNFARRRPAAFAALSAAAVSAAALVVSAPARSGQVAAARGWHGAWSVVERDGLRELFHGNTDHGAQRLDPVRRREPAAYYSFDSPLGEAWTVFGRAARAIGAVGLGTGAVAAHARAGQELVFYELDPAVERLARERFTYLTDSPASTRVVIGDARVELSRTAPGSYDLLVVDAFSSGAVPVHLATTEALSLYASRLRPGGAIVFHLSNRYLDLRSVLAAEARALGLSGAAKRVEAGARVREDDLPSTWAVFTTEKRALAPLLAEPGWKDLGAEEFARGRAWTDSFASPLRALAL